MDSLENDHTFPTTSGIFGEQFIQTFIESKRSEIVEEKMRPTPWEFEKYYDV